MPKLGAHNFSISLDGFGAGPDQELKNPLGVGGMALHQWFVATRTFQKMHGGDGGATGIDDDIAARGFENVGAWILGRNMFGPLRGAWPDTHWNGWWGEEPPYHVPVFVLTHHPRPSVVMKGGTTFHFVTGGIEEALNRAKEAAAGRDVRLGGGVSTIRQYLEAKLLDEIHLAVAPILLGRGEALLVGLDLPSLGYQCSIQANTPAAMHVTIRRT